MRPAVAFPTAIALAAAALTVYPKTSWMPIGI